LLDTGGGLKKAAWFFLEDSSRRDSNRGDSAKMDEPFLLHNVDVISTIDVRRMLQFHTENHALATLAVQPRDSSRLLLFNDQLQLSGRLAGQSEDRSSLATRHSPLLSPLAFSGIHVISSRLLPMITEEGVFSIIDTYLRLAAQGEKILAFRADQYYWRDLGRPDDLAQAALDLRQNLSF
jgi:NDP-sugar pyrophosphorylase family protein